MWIPLLRLTLTSWAFDSNDVNLNKVFRVWSHCVLLVCWDCITFFNKHPCCDFIQDFLFRSSYFIVLTSDHTVELLDLTDCQILVQIWKPHCMNWVLKPARPLLSFQIVNLLKWQGTNRHCHPVIWIALGLQTGRVVGVFWGQRYHTWIHCPTWEEIPPHQMLIDWEMKARSSTICFLI